MTTFGTTGYTFNNVFLLYDRLSRTVWYPLKDGAFDGLGGPLQGKQIPFIDKPPITTLGEWRREHPETEVLLDGRARLEASSGEPALESREIRPYG